jgi:protein phosphatase 1 regulatory subunit 7
VDLSNNKIKELTSMP